MTLSDLIVEYLEQFGIEYVFGVPGSPLGPLFDALARSERRGGPRAVLARHEAGAAFIADGYARESGRIGVCCSTTGPGATNLITGVASAYAEQIPMLVITSQTRVPEFSFGCFQDSSRDGIDIMSMFEHCTRFNSMVTHSNQLEKKLSAALATALGNPKGPAHLSIPIDIFAAKADGPATFRNLAALHTAPVATIDLAAFDRLFGEIMAVLERGGKITILAGHNCRGAGEEISRFAEAAAAEIVTTPRGKSAINSYHPLSRGVFGCAGHASARQALADEKVELILAVGTNLGEWSTSKWDPLLMSNKLIHIHSDRSAFTRSPMARLNVQGSISTVFNRLNERLKGHDRIVTRPDRIDPDDAARSAYIPSGITVRNVDCCRPAADGQLLKAPQVYYELIRRLPRETRYFIDNSNSVPWSIHYFFHSRPESYHLSIEFATMAWAVGAAIGGAFANQGVPSVCIAGDGCYLMSGQEITVAVEQQLPVLFVILNDQAYGLIRHGHRVAGTEQVEYRIPAVDFAMMARAAGAEAYTIREGKDFDEIDWQALALRQGPTLLDVIIDPEVTPPLSMA
ncbi:MAG: thiamine pyrophosphate-binding protein [Deltaproteobacteria bacterium]|nr:thiamine pyrophosphate-binding protein [Deltaproteobacteria bacterium]TLN02845.1 MAG: thiamine pyrophosphate-binding protein [bacterium]